jgi:GxxExxY protein
MFVDGRIVVELKSVELLHPIHVAQVLSYLRLTGARLGLLINFNVPMLKHGIRRVIL